MYGVLLCKFDERRGYIPLNPILVDDDKYREDKALLKEIARNAIGFGSQLEFNSFSLGGVNCISQRFSIPSEEARGGSVTNALVIISDKEVTGFKELLKKTVEQLKNKEEIEENLKLLYDAVKYPEQPLLIRDKAEEIKPATPTRIYDSTPFHTVKKSIFSDYNSVPRNFTMGLGCSLILILFVMVFAYSKPFENFDFWKYLYTNIMMFFIGLFIYFAINKKRFLRQIEYMLIILFFIIPIYTVITRDMILYVLHTWIFFTSFISAIFICVGLDYEAKIDKVSFLILIFLIIIIFMFILIYYVTS